MAQTTRALMASQTTRALMASRTTRALVASLATLAGALGLASSARAEDPYVEADGSSYLETDYFPNPDTCVVVDFALTEVTSQARVFGVEETDDFSLAFYANAGKNWAYCHKDGAWASVVWGAADTERHTVVFDSFGGKCSLITGGATNYTGNISWTRTKTAKRVLHFFSQNDGTFEWGWAKERIYSAKIYEKGVLVRDYVPCIRNGLAGLRDKLTDKFIFSRDGNNLASGGDIETITVDDGYLQSTGTAYIDTGYKPTPNTRIEADFEMLSTNANNKSDKQPRICGSNGLRYVLYVNGSYCFAFSAFDSVYGPTSGYGYQTSTGYAADIGVRHTFFVDQFRNRAALTTPGKAMKKYSVATTMTNLTEATQSLWIFGGPDWNQKSKMKLYGLKIYEADNIVHDYIPGIRERVPGLYDRATGEFLSYPSGTVGGNVNDDAYLVADGSQGIVSDYYANPGTKVEVDFSFNSVATKQQRIFGADSDNTANPLSFSLYLNGGGNLAYAFQDGKGNWSGLFAATNNARYLVTLDGPNNKVTVSGGGKASATITTTRTGTSKNPLGIFCDYENGSFCRAGGNIRLYSLSCYDNGVLTRRYLPYKSGDKVGLYDIVAKKAFLNSRSGGKAFGIGGMGFEGSATNLLVKPVDARAKRTKPAVLTAFAPGAVAYRWFADGEEIAGETAAELSVPWREGETLVPYEVRPVFEIAGRRIEGESASATVDFRLRGMTVLVK